MEQVEGTDYNYKCIRYTYNHNNSPDFHKIIVAVYVGNSITPLPHFYVQYYFDNEEHPISFTKSHGSSKNPAKIIQHTTYSVRYQIKNLASKGIKGKEIFNRVFQSAGGFEGANSSAKLPASYTQIYDISRKMKLKEGKEMKDQIMELIDMCNSQKGTSTMFLREVRTAPELSLVLANERQLDDIERFGTRSPFTVLGVDPTFNICDYNVTITTYRHPLLLVKNDNIHPVMLGPILIDTNKSFESYFTLPSTLIRLRPSYTSLKAFGTDGELNVYSAFKSCFNKAQHLLCWIHAKENIENKLSKLQVKDKNIYMEEIFGKTSGNIKIKGLLDCFEENEFLAEWKNLEEKWKKKEWKGISFLNI